MLLYFTVRDAAALKNRFLKTPDDQTLAATTGAKLADKIMRKFKTNVQFIRAESGKPAKEKQPALTATIQSNNQPKDKPSRSKNIGQSSNQSLDLSSRKHFTI